MDTRMDRRRRRREGGRRAYRDGRRVRWRDGAGREYAKLLTSISPFVKRILYFGRRIP